MSAAAVLAGASLGSINTYQNMLRAAGPQSEHIARLWNIMFGVTGVVFVLVVAAMLFAVVRAPRGDETTPPDLSSLEQHEPRLTRRVLSAIGLSIVGLLGLLTTSVLTDRALARLSLEHPLHIRLTANQFWWDARYEDGQPSDVFGTANELVVPVGRPVVMRLESNDVIHSFWVPNLHGKKDLIPGRTALIEWRADTPGVYRGQCAEFCGNQHAKMALWITAVSAVEFEQWAAAQRAAAPSPTDAKQQRGQQIFLSTTCAMCHAIQGTSAQGRRGPDLTHLASRRSIGAGALPNTPQSLAAWISNPHSAKPGVNMPNHTFSQEDLDALVSYLSTLK